MKRPIVLITISYIIGIILGLYFKINIISIFLFIAIFVYSCISRKWVVVIIVSVSLIGYLYINFFEKSFEEVYKIQEITFVGVIVDIRQTDYNTIYTVKMKSVNRLKENKKFLVTIKKCDMCFEYGDLIMGKGGYIKPSTSRNYKGYDYSKYLKTKKIYGTIEIEKIEKVESKSINVCSLWIGNLKNKIQTNIFSIMNNSNANLLLGILLGDTQRFDDEVKEIFSKSSLSHILAVSGMHVSNIVLGISLLLSKFSKRKSKYFIIVFLLFYMCLVGFTPSVVRAVIMTILVIISSLIYRKSDVLSNLFLSGLIILFVNPYSIFNLGFQLSFGGTLGILMFYDLLNRKIIFKNKILEFVKQMCIVSISANILITPVLILNFNNLSFVFLISNILVGSILTVILIYGIIVIVLSFLSVQISIFFSPILEWLLNLLYLIASFCSKISFLQFIVVTPKAIIIIIYYVVIFFRKSKYKKIIIIVCILIFLVVFIFEVKAKFNSNLKLYFVDVGQGDCTLIVTPTNKKILIDGGGSELGDFDVGKKILVPYLLDRQIKKIDYIMISHFDSDHWRGLEEVVKVIDVKNIIISKQGEISENYKNFVKLVKNKNVNIIIVEQADRIVIDKYCYFDIIWPQKQLINENMLNNNSIVTKFTFKNFKILFTGDIEEAAEECILNSIKIDLSSDILKVAHHGSKTSSTEEFLKRVNPQICLIGVGEGNLFNHPNELIIDRLQKAKIKVFRTDVYGEIVIRFDENMHIFTNIGNTRIKVMKR